MLQATTVLAMSGPSAAKRFPRSLASPGDPRDDQADQTPLVLGGSITRSPEGRLQTLQTHGIHPSPQGVQGVWSNASRRRYPKAWQGQRIEQVGYAIEWEPREIVCGKCHRSLGRYVAYRIRYADGRLQGEQGIVEDTSRRYEQQAETARGQAASRGPKSRPRFRLEGEVGRRAAKTTACFRCPSCRAEFQRNLARLGAQVLASGSPFLLDRA
jgi:hypothetical protein